MARLSIILFVVLTAFSCSEKPTGWQEVVVGDEYAIEVPGRFVRGYDMHDFAPLQFEDPEAEAYLIGLSQEKGELEEMNLKYTLEDYAWFLSRNISSAIDTIHDSYSMRSDVNGHAAVFTEIFGQVLDGLFPVPIRYSLAVIEGKSRYYQFVCWGGEKEIMSMQNELETMICSFHEAGGIGTSEAAPGSGAASAN